MLMAQPLPTADGWPFEALHPGSPTRPIDMTTRNHAQGCISGKLENPGRSKNCYTWTETLRSGPTRRPKNHMKSEKLTALRRWEWSLAWRVALMCEFSADASTWMFYTRSLARI